MPVPKHKTAKTKSRIRRANAYYTMKTPALSDCPNCGEKKMPHRVCPSCGYYKGKQIITKLVTDNS